MSDDFTNQLSELEMSRWLFQQKSIFVAKNERFGHMSVHMRHVLNLAFNAYYTLWEKAVLNVKNI